MPTGLPSPTIASAWHQIFRCRALMVLPGSTETTEQDRTDDRGAQAVAKTKTGKIHAILGRSHRTGRWRLSPKTSLIAFLGSCRLDLRDAHLDDEVSKMSATVILGGVTIIIPPGVEVRPSGLSLLGGASVDVPTFDNNEAALIEIEWTSIFGRLRIGADFETGDESDDAPAEEGVDAQFEAANDSAPTPVSAGKAAPEAAPEPPPAIGFEDLDEPEPAPPVGFEDLDEPETSAGIGFDDLPPVQPASDEPSSIGFADLPPVEPAPAVGFEDLDEPQPPTEPAPAVGFEDLDEPQTPTEPAPAVGFEDLDKRQPPTEPAPAVGFEDLDEGQTAAETEETPAEPPVAVGFEDL